MVGVGEGQHDSHSWADPDGIQMFVIRINVPAPVAGERITFSFDHDVGVERSIGCTVTNMVGNEIELRMGGQAVGGLHDLVELQGWREDPLTPWEDPAVPPVPSVKEIEGNKLPCETDAARKVREADEARQQEEQEAARQAERDRADADAAAAVQGAGAFAARFE